MTATMTNANDKAVDSPLGPRGTGRPNKILLNDYANGEGWVFRVETDVGLEPNEVATLREWLELPPSPATNKEIVKLLHSKVERTGSGLNEKDQAKKMFSAGFGLLP
jgi:hypothetical protein